MRWAHGDVDAALSVLDAEVTDGELRFELEADRAAFAVLGAPEHRPAEGLDRAETLAGDTPAERRMLATLAFHRMIWGVTTGAEVGRLAERALAGGRLLEDVGPGHPSVLAVLSTLQVVERDADVEALDRRRRAPRRRSRPPCCARCARGWPCSAATCAAAEAAAREVLAVADDAGLEHIRRFTVPTLVLILVERGELDAAEAELAAGEAVHHDGTLWLLLQARAALRPRPRPGLRRRGARPRAAVERRRQQRARRGRAGALTAAAPRRRARSPPAPSSTRAAGACRARSAWRCAPKGSSRASSSRCARPSTRSRRRRGGSSTRARSWISAPRCGGPTAAPTRARSWPRAWSSPIAAAPTRSRLARARSSSRAARARGGCVRTGVDALTPSELRVAQLAAAGHSNREIAQALFVTRKTVETHLGGIYRKLGVNAREHLAAKLQDPPPDAKPRAAREAVAP